VFTCAPASMSKRTIASEPSCAATHKACVFAPFGSAPRAKRACTCIASRRRVATSRLASVGTTCGCRAALAGMVEGGVSHDITRALHIAMSRRLYTRVSSAPAACARSSCATASWPPSLRHDALRAFVEAARRRRAPPPAVLTWSEAPHRCEHTRPAPASPLARRLFEARHAASRRSEPRVAPHRTVGAQRRSRRQHACSGISALCC